MNNTYDNIAFIEDLQKRKERAAVFTRTDYENMSLNRVQTIAEGMIPGYEVMSKDELINAIMESVEATLTIAKAKEALTLECQGELDFDQRFIRTFYERGKTEPERFNPQSLAQGLLNNLRAKRHKDTTICKTDAKVFRSTLTLLSANREIPYQWGDEAYNHFRTLIVDITQKVNKEGRDLVERYATLKDEEVLIMLDPNTVIKWTYDTLVLTVNGEFDKRGWQRVSLALAIATGRRQAEIHGKTTFLPSVKPDHLQISGLLKKESKDVGLEAPCLVSPQLWLDAYNRTKTAYPQRFDLEPEVVHKKLSKPLSDYLGGRNGCPHQCYDYLGFPNYKTSRDFYGSFIGKYYHNPRLHGTLSNFLASIYGHENITTSHSYEKILLTEEISVETQDIVKHISYKENL